MSLHSLRLQLFGIALILVGGLASVQAAATGYGYSDVYRYVVLLGLLAALAGFLGPLLAAGDADAGATDEEAEG
ncbi:hypothetical protein EFA46_011990 (plasmid) [Halarchaeum sp. CBA1220]|uniref:hypothetical protein n=1 Tax=Halarchaeum sp. CBA1220 TaxID=1853682 RepID=UPI000F3A9003|nr:hypothetical protein [Halarchaeum sp. CBA1220]QLC34971.1 hypothetical protein EFA46_011990 [Halarchaeum sp. CBA1220]